MVDKPGSPIFSEAVRRFQDFLRGQEWPEAILWFGSEDFGRVPGKPVIVLGRVRGDGSADAATSYERGRRASLGVSLEGVCTRDGATCAIVAYPADECEAELLMYLSDGSLKLSVAVPRTEAVER